jgi:hypothetical protein
MESPEEIIKRHKKRLREIQKNPRKFITGVDLNPKYFFGFNKINKRAINLHPDEFKKHWHLLGSTGKGKTKLLEHIGRTLIDNREGLCLIDPHGDLYQSLRDYLVLKRIDHKAIFIDPNNTESMFGINYLERGDHILKDIDAHVSMVMRAIAKVFGGENQDTLPRLQHWERNTIHALMEQGYTLVEMLHFLSLTNPEARHKIIEKLIDPYIKLDWHEFEHLKKQEKEIRIESVLNRAAKFVGSQRIRQIVGQSKSTINFRKAMDEGKIILVNLSPMRISREAQKMLGVMIVDLIVEAGFSRANIAEERRKPFYLIVDEFGEFVCDDFAFALETLRKYGVFLMLSNQHMDQLKRESSRVYSSVMANCDNKVAFGISREDAEVMAKELFTGMIRGDKIKQIIEQTKFEPKETTRTSIAKAESESRGEGLYGGQASGEYGSLGNTQLFGPEGPTFFTDALSQSILSSEATSAISSSGSSEIFTSSQSYAESEAPWYEYEMFKEISSIHHFTPEEMLEKFISWIKNQGVRQAQLKIGIKKPAPMVTPEVEDIRVRPEDVKTFENYLNSKYAKPIELIEKELENRRIFLTSKKEPEEPTSFRE